jgi:hypothetical protein
MEPQIAINPTNPNNVVLVSQTDIGGGGTVIVVSRSFDGGQTWSDLYWGSQDGYGSTNRPDARVAFDPYGNLYMAYMVASGSNTNIVVARSVDGGGSFYATSVAVNGAKFDPDSPWLATGNSTAKKSRKAIWMTFTDYDSHRVMIVGATSSGLGNFSGWATPRRVSNSWGSYANVSVGPSGQVAVAWQSSVDGNAPNSVMFNVDSTGTGSGFGSDRALFTTNVGGWDYIPAQPDRSIDAEVKIAYDNSGDKTTGRLYLAYTNESPFGSHNTDIYFTYSDNNGGSWAAQKRVNDDSTKNSQFLPTLAVDQTTGNVGLSWLDARNSAGNNTVQTFSTVSLDHGATFQPNVQVSAGTSNQAWANPTTNDLDFGDNGGMAFYAGRMIPAWADNSGAVGGNPNGGHSKLDIVTAVLTIS